MDQVFGHLFSAVRDWLKSWMRRRVVSPREEQLLAEAQVLETRRVTQQARRRIAARTYLDRRAIGRRVS